MGSLFSSVGFRSAQSSGLSPSPTEEVGSKALTGQETHAEEELKSSITEEKPLEEPESNDTSYGVEATAVRTLAASTGTVAILGTTAKVKESNESTVSDLKQSPIEVTQNESLVPSSELQNVDVVISSETLDTSDKNVTIGKVNDEVKTEPEFLCKTSENETEVTNKIEEKKESKTESSETPAAFEKTDPRDKENIKPNQIETSDETTIKLPVDKLDTSNKSNEIETESNSGADITTEVKLIDEPKINPIETSSVAQSAAVVEQIEKSDESNIVLTTENITYPFEKSETDAEVKVPIIVEQKEQISEVNTSDDENISSDKVERNDKENLTWVDEKTNQSGEADLPSAIGNEVLSFRANIPLEPENSEEIVTTEKREAIVETKTSSAVTVEKEPFRITDFQEKRDRVHEPKIVEEMSLKKEDKFDKLKDSEEMAFKKEIQLKLNVSDKQDSKDDFNECSIQPEMEEKISLSRAEITPEEEVKITPESEPVSPEVSKTEEDNEISSEQLKTNSLSDMSLSEALNSEYEEAVREAAKAQELKEMVASLSATANRTTLDYEISEESSSSKEISRNDATVGTSLQELENFEQSISQPSITDAYNIPDKQGNLKHETSVTVSHKTHEHEKNIQLTNATILEASEDVASSSETSLEEKEPNKLVEEEKIATSEPKSNVKKTENDTVEEKEQDETEIEVGSKQNNDNEPIIEIKTTDEDGSPQKNNVLESKENEEQNEKEGKEIIAAATKIQSGFRGYQVRKQLRESEDVKEVKHIEEEETEKSSSDDAKTLLDGETVSSVSNILYEKGQLEEQEKNLLEPIQPKILDNTEVPTTLIMEDGVKYIPESLMKIAQAEVDKICKEAEKATESLITPPIAKEEQDIEESEIQDEDFPAPPDDLLRSESKTEESKDEQSSSGTQTTEPTMPLGNNHTEGDSSKTEDTTAPSLAESEMPKSMVQTQSHQNQDLRLESSATENINTEVAALQRDSTEGELTMEEDSTREDDLPPAAQFNTVIGENSMTTNEEKAATVIQAGYRGFKTRKRLREEPSTESPVEEELKIDSTQHEIRSEENSNSNESEPNSVDSSSKGKSDKELNDSAKKIQAGVRGYLVRKRQKIKRDAAVTIQSHFRGFKTRQRLKKDSS